MEHQATLFSSAYACQSPAPATSAGADPPPDRPAKRARPARAAGQQSDRPDTERLLVTEREAAHQLSMSPRKLWELRNRGEIPCVRFGRIVRYDPKDLKAWIIAHKSKR